MTIHSSYLFFKALFLHLLDLLKCKEWLKLGQQKNSNILSGCKPHSIIKQILYCGEPVLQLLIYRCLMNCNNAILVQFKNLNYYRHLIKYFLKIFHENMDFLLSGLQKWKSKIVFYILSFLLHCISSIEWKYLKIFIFNSIAIRLALPKMKPLQIDSVMLKMALVFFGGSGWRLGRKERGMTIMCGSGSLLREIEKDQRIHSAWFGIPRCATQIWNSRRF